MSSKPAPAEGDGRTRRERSLPQQLAAARGNLGIERDELKALGRAIVKAETAGKMGKARTLRAIVPERRASIKERERQLAELEELARGEE